jgi:hypothetical protein
MNLNDLNLLESLRADAAAGTLHFKKRRMLLLNANFLGLLRKQLVTVCGLPEARNLVAFLGYASGYQAALAVRELYATESKETLWQVWAHLYAQQGFAAVKPLSSTFDERRSISPLKLNLLTPAKSSSICYIWGRATGLSAGH